MQVMASSPLFIIFRQNYIGRWSDTNNFISTSCHWNAAYLYILLHFSLFLVILHAQCDTWSVTIQNENMKDLKGGLGSIITDAICQSIIRILFQGETLDYLGIPGFHLAGSQGVIVIAICQAILMVMISNFIQVFCSVFNFPDIRFYNLLWCIINHQHPK